MFGTVNDLK